jgi:hypothetical protein
MIEKADRYDYVDHLHRITQFRRWIDSNILFPIIPDIIVKPLREQLCKAEKILVGELYTRDELDKITAIQKVE